MTKHHSYLTVKEAAAYLGITVERVRQLCANGKLPSVYRPFGYREIRHIAQRDLDKRKASLPPTAESSK